MKKKTTKSKTKILPSEQPALLKLFTDGIKDLYWAENHLVKNLPKMIKAVTTQALADAIILHLDETTTHVSRLEQIFELIGEKAQAQKCDAMEGLGKEGEHIIENTEAGTATRDVGIILSSQKIEHYEIASYGGLHQLALILGMDDVAKLLSQTLEEEKNADSKLTEVAENDINYKAAKEA